ncbi:MAG: M20/M25/M40 family metallo-hydrolase, partial [Verrucomicrobiales bacterium]|nr:M20/M25/M40 family metallo-hydrolase [Verrucomicrobiales bacterium]
ASKLLRELIAIPSVNPAFLAAGDARAGEKRVADFLGAIAASRGLDIELREVFPGRANLLAHYAPPGAVRRRIVLAPHMDTVGEPGLSDALFEPREQNGRLYGRGACDTKGSVAAMLTALTEVANSPKRPQHTAITFAGLVDEENGQKGSRALVRDKFKADLAIVGEPTQLKVVTAHKGDLWLRVETHGQSAHGAKPELGRNAVLAMARIVDLLETKYARALDRKRHPLLGHATVNVGAIRGGSQPNIVPDHCEISVDRRTIPGETEAGVWRELRSFLRQRHHKARLINSKDAACLPLETDPGLPLVQELFRAAGQKEPAGVDFFCDAAVLSGGGIPSVVFGPGDIAQAHTAAEWISLRSLEAATAVLIRFLQAQP